MANNPKHGDEIIVSQKSALGGTKLVAGRQFQEFLDDIGNNPVSTADIIQQLAILDGQVNTSRAEINRLDKALDDATQLIAVLDALRDSPVADAAPSGGVSVRKSQLFTASGTWSLPANIIGNPRITGCAGGGSGAIGGVAQGGNGGECCDQLEIVVTASVVVTIGLGGASVTTGAGNTGGTTTFGAFITLLGGGGGANTTASANSQGGSYGGVASASITRPATSMSISRSGSPGRGNTSNGDNNGGGGGLILTTSNVGGGDSSVDALGGKGFGAGGASGSSGTSGAGAPAALLVEWDEAA